MRREGKKRRAGREEARPAAPEAGRAAEAAVDAGSSAAAPGGPNPPASPGPAWPQVALSGQASQPVVCGKPKPLLGPAQYNAVQALLEAGPAGLSKDELVRRSGHGDAVRVIKRLRASDPDWAAVLPLPGRSWKHYRVL